jgi:hypothetical protein
LESLLSAFKVAVKAEQERRLAAAVALDKQITYSQNPSLETFLTLNGIIGQGVALAGSDASGTSVRGSTSVQRKAVAPRNTAAQRNAAAQRKAIARRNAAARRNASARRRGRGGTGGSSVGIITF